MDQLAPVIAWIRRNLFWIGCFLVSVVAIAFFFVFSGQLAEAQKTREAAIKKSVSELDAIGRVTAEEGATAHPNQSTKEGMELVIDQTIASTAKAWEIRYRNQAKFFRWSEEVFGEETAREFAKVKIIEKFDKNTTEFDEGYLNKFYSNVPKFMTQICRELGTNWLRDPAYIQEQLDRQNTFRTNAGSDNSEFNNREVAIIEERNRYAVTWSEVNQDLWYRKLTTFQGYDDNNGTSNTPTFLQANMLMQDLWLLEAMFKNIKAINGNATSNDTSYIREINHIAFGREAEAGQGVLTEPDQRLAGIVESSLEDVGSSSLPAVPVPVAVFDLNAERNSYQGRYVDAKYDRIPASAIRDVIGGESLPAENLELIVAKRVPFRLGVKIDERKIHDFIAQCANSDFVFEVNQLRINRHDNEELVIPLNGGASLLSGFDAVGGGSTPLGGEEYVEAESKFASTQGSGAVLQARNVESRTNFDVSLELFGVIRIYNPVRENFLRLAAGQQVVDETAQKLEAPEQPNNPAATPTPPAAGPTPPAAGPATSAPVASSAPGTNPAPGTSPAPVTSPPVTNPAPAPGLAPGPSGAATSAPATAPAAVPGAGGTP